MKSRKPKTADDAIKSATTVLSLIGSRITAENCREIIHSLSPYIKDNTLNELQKQRINNILKQSYYYLVRHAAAAKNYEDAIQYGFKFFSLYQPAPAGDEAYNSTKQLFTDAYEKFFLAPKPRDTEPLKVTRSMNTKFGKGSRKGKSATSSWSETPRSAESHKPRGSHGKK